MGGGVKWGVDLLMGRVLRGVALQLKETLTPGCSKEQGKEILREANCGQRRYKESLRKSLLWTGVRWSSSMPFITSPSLASISAILCCRGQHT